MDFPELSSEVLKKKLHAVEETGAGLLVTDCPGCVLQLRGGMDKRGSRARSSTSPNSSPQRTAPLARTRSKVWPTRTITGFSTAINYKTHAGTIRCIFKRSSCRLACYAYTKLTSNK